jgi:hypothetical protein
VFDLAMCFNLVAAAVGLLIVKPMRNRHFAALRAEQAPAMGADSATQVRAEHN